MTIRKAVIPAAGFGTRFLPASKSSPKEMLPIVDKPAIQYVVEEAVHSGITDILIVTGKGKRAIEDHFDRNFELEAELQGKQKEKELQSILEISELANVYFIRQKQLNGLGDAISYARNHIGKEPFAVLLGDTLVQSKRPLTRQLMDVYDRYGESVVVLEQVPREKISRYGVISGHSVEDGLYLINDFVEKPAPEEAPSDLAIAGRYVFTPEIFDFIEKTNPGKNNEIQLTDAMRAMVRARAMYGLKLDGTRYDIGNKLDFLKTNVAFALNRPELGPPFRQFLDELNISDQA